MKKLFTLMLVIALCFAVVGCGDSSSGGEPKATDTQNQEQEVETTYPNGVRLSDKNPFLITIVPEIFDLTQEVVEDFPDYKDENLE